MTRKARSDPRARVRALASPVARSRRLEFVLPEAGRVAEVARLLDDPEIARWTLRIPHPYRVADARAYVRRWRRRRRTGTVLSLHIVRRTDRALVGGIGLSDIDSEHRRAEIGYWIGRPYRHRGYAREAVTAICRLAYRKLGLTRVEAGVFPGNVASVGVLRASGFRREGRMRQTVRKDGVPRDVILYARLRDDPPAPGGGAGGGPPRRGVSVTPTR